MHAQYLNGCQFISIGHPVWETYTAVLIPISTLSVYKNSISNTVHSSSIDVANSTTTTTTLYTFIYKWSNIWMKTAKIDPTKKLIKGSDSHISKIINMLEVYRIKATRRGNIRKHKTVIITAITNTLMDSDLKA